MATSLPILDIREPGTDLRRTVLKVQLDLPPQQATLGIDVINHHSGHVGIGNTRE